MPTRMYKPTSPGRRFMSVMDNSGLSKEGPETSLLAPIKSTGGRNAEGRVTARPRRRSQTQISHHRLDAR